VDASAIRARARPEA